MENKVTTKRVQSPRKVTTTVAPKVTTIELQSFKYADCSTCSKKLGLDTYKNTRGFFTEYSMTIPSEDMAEVYSHLISGDYTTSNDKILNKKIKFIKDKLNEIDNTFVF